MDNNLFNVQKYEPQIKKIQRIESILVNVTRVLTIILIVSVLPLKITLPTGKTIIDFGGLNPIVAFLLIVLCYAIELLLISRLITPRLSDPLTVECDPEKYLAINMAAARPHLFKLACITGYLYLGNYTEVIRCANDAINSKNPKYVLTALYNKAYAEFLLGDYDALKSTADAFCEKLSQNPKSSEKLSAEWLGSKLTIELLVAIADKDTDSISKLKYRIEPSNTSKASEIIVRYTKGLAEATVDNTEVAVSELEWVKENAEKTAFSSLADEKLKSLI
jgi:hypothetical protein